MFLITTVFHQDNIEGIVVTIYKWHIWNQGILEGMPWKHTLTNTSSHNFAIYLHEGETSKCDSLTDDKKKVTVLHCHWGGENIFFLIIHTNEIYINFPFNNIRGNKEHLFFYFQFMQSTKKSLHFLQLKVKIYSFPKLHCIIRNQNYIYYLCCWKQ